MGSKITKTTTLGEVLSHGPETAEVLRRYNMGCMGCRGARNHRLEQGALSHGHDVEQLLQDLNTALKG